MRSGKDILFTGVILLFSLYLSYVFIDASISKISDPISFSESISAYEIMPYWSVNLIALFFPWIELLSGIFLLICMNIGNKSFKYYGRLPNKDHPLLEASVNIIMLMILWFIFILSIAILRGLDIDCGCGIGEEVLPKERLFEDIVLFIIIILIKYRTKIGTKIGVKFG